MPCEKLNKPAAADDTRWEQQIIITRQNGPTGEGCIAVVTWADSVGENPTVNTIHLPTELPVEALDAVKARIRAARAYDDGKPAGEEFQ